MNFTGFIVPHLGPSQQSNEVIQFANSNDNVAIFFEQLLTPFIKVNCGTLCVNELMAFRGLLISSNIENTIMAHKLTNRNLVKLVFYMWDLEWLRNDKRNYMYNIRAYNMPDVLAVRHDEHVDPVYNYCNRKPIVIKDFSQVIKC